MALAREVIDLISDSEDESPTKSATSTLQAFVPRKEKAPPNPQRTIVPPASTSQPAKNTPVAPRPLAPATSTLQASVPRKENAVPKSQRTIVPPASTLQPAKNTPVAPKPLVPAPARNTTNSSSKTPAGASIAEILSQGLQSAARSAGLLPRQLQEQSQKQSVVKPPSNVNNYFLPHTVLPGQPYNDVRSDAVQQPLNGFKFYGKPAHARKVPRTNWSLHEERERRFVQYHQKEAGRKGQSVERVGEAKAGAAGSANGRAAATTQQGALSPSGTNLHSSAQLHQDGPQVKRRKTEHEAIVDKVAFGMSEARRLSAATITERHESVIHDRGPGRAVPHFRPSNSIDNDQVAPVVAKPHSESIDLTKEMDVYIDDSQPSIVANQSSSKHDSRQSDVNLATAASLNGTADADCGDSPDASLAAKMDIYIDDSQPSIVVNHVLSKLDASGSDVEVARAAIPTGVADADESDSPDEIPARPVQKRSPVAHQGANPAHRTCLEPKTMPVTKKDLSLDADLQIDLETRNDPLIMPKVIGYAGKGKGNHGVPYSAEEDSLLARLREDLGVTWEAMPKYFCGRTQGSLQVRYSSKVKNRNSVSAKPQSASLQKSTLNRTAVRPEYTAPSRRHPKVSQRDDGFVSWAELKAQRKADRAIIKSASPPTTREASTPTPGLGLDFDHPASLPRLLRARELGNTGRRNWSSTARLSVPDELQNHVLDTLGPRRYFHGASRDVACVAWARDGNRFAAGAIAIDDERSMQYNRPNNLLLGDLEQNSLQELPEHHVARPIVDDSRNVNSLQAMQETQDCRLFKTVAAVDFSADSRALYSAGADGVVRMYDTSNGLCLSSLKQEAEIALLTSNPRGLLASGSHRSDDASISVIRSHSDRLEHVCQFGPTRANVESSLPIFPTALKWGAGMHSHLLLAGFASDSYEDDRLAAGEVFLWDATSGQKIELPSARNVFDVAWNPIPSSQASLFAVACAGRDKNNRSSVQCFAPNQGRASRVLQWDCPAFDINDLTYCPHDDNLIAAGATDGKVYIWDKRVVRSNQKPLHTLSHGNTKNILDHDRDVELADTGVRFLSWSATGNRLYSGSSDGTVKVWNPYRSTEDALVKDVATFNSAVMSGAFSPDFRDLLIGEDQSQLNLLGIDREARSVRAAKKFDYYPAPAPVPAVNEDKLAPARESLASGQVKIRPMGVLPVKQAVQGPNYQGPFAGPSAEEISRLGIESDLALHKQIAAEEALRGKPQDPEAENACQAANLQIIQCAEASNRASEEREKYDALRLKALILQERFHKSKCEHERAFGGSSTKSCELDCNYLPAAGDEDSEAPDDRRSEQRIPSSLLTRGRVFDASDLNNAEIAEAGLTSKCSACMGPAAKSKRGLPICERCTLVRSGLTARCEKCAFPVRPNLDESIRQTICERCGFRCFRCGCTALLSLIDNTVTCQTCGMQWEAGVLGYEVKRKPHSSPVQVREQSHEQMMESLDERMGMLLGEDERERLAGGWRVALVDGSIGY